MTYQDRWLFAVATKRGYPRPFEAGEVAPATAEAPESGIRTQLAGAANALRQFQVIVWIGGLGVAVVAGVVGYAIGRSRS